MTADTIAVLAALATVAFLAVPASMRFLRLAAVLGWCLVWWDGGWQHHWLDYLGAGVVLTSLILVIRWLTRPSSGASGRGGEGGVVG
ncbi:hypothetical protein [Amycolatopsis suaedae]|uniref:Uncharacterized protein n=1 Tax=Amycolatopsis suaedae TaxID=2510978 RepID=A0A4Q7JBV3_9PSEU|nr:hypothetical protein [Amycolatopsis suaedae]RZQ64588.1 hypothetical protein EWH70_06685 [Amycolatopsis suaedae]